MAVRENIEDRRLMFRRGDGSGEVELFSSADAQYAVPKFRPAESWELEGFDDWSPAVSFGNPSRIELKGKNLK